MKNYCCICVSLRKGANNIIKLYGRVLSILDMRITEYSVFKSIHYLGIPTSNLLLEKIELERTSI